MEKQIQFIQTSPEELTNQIGDEVKYQLEEFNKNFESNQSKEFLSRHQVAEILDCHISTIDNLCDKKILTKYQIGGMIRFRADEVVNSFVKLK